MHLRRVGIYAAAIGQQHDHRRAAVLEFLGCREAELTAAIGRFEDSDDDVLETFLQSVPVALLEEAHAHGPIDGSDAACRDLEAVVADYRASGQAVIELYQQLGASLVGPRAKELFADLAEMERRGQKSLQHALLDF